MSTRLDYIDVAKGLGILLVVIGHNQALSDATPDVHRVIYLFHMPLFFFLSGITTPLILLKAQLGRRLAGLAKPYLVSTLIFAPRQLLSPEHPSNQNTIYNIAWGSGTVIYNTPAWFLVGLISGYALYSFIQFIRMKLGTEKSLPFFAVAAIPLTYWALGTQFGFELLPKTSVGRVMGAPLNTDLAPIIASFLLLGAWSKRPLAKIHIQNGRTLIPITLIFSCLFYFSSFIIGTPFLDLNYREARQWPTALLCSALGISVILVASICIDRYLNRIKSLLIFLGQNTLIILIFHAAFQSALTRFFPHEIGAGGDLAISFLVCICLAWLSERINQHSKIRLLFFPKKQGN